MDIDNFSGFIYYKGEEHFFVFENYELTIAPNSSKNILIYNSRSIFESISNKEIDETIKDLIIDGICFDGKGVTFCIQDCRWIKKGTSTYKVKWVYIHSSGLDYTKIKGIEFLSQEINYFYDTKRYINDDYKIEDGHFKYFTVNVEALKRKQLGKFKYNNLNFNIYGDMAWKKNYDVSNNLEVWSKLSIETDNELSGVEEVYNIVLLQKIVIDVLTYRTNNTFDSIEVYNYDNEKNKHILGRFYISDECNKEKDYKLIKRLITSNDISNIGILYELIDDGKIYTSHICDSSKTQSIYNASRMLGIMIAFERIINWKFDKNLMRNDQYLELLKRMNDLVVANKEKLCLDLKKNKIKFNKTVKSIFEPEVSLATRIINAIKEYPITTSLIANIYGTKPTKKIINEISERTNKLRNDMAHGNIDIEFDNNNIKDLRFMEIFVYILILNELNLSDEEIVSKIMVLFNIRNFLNLS